MNTSTTRSRRVRPATVKAAAAFGLALALGVVSTAPAFGDDHHPGQNHGNQHASSRQGHNGNGQGNQRYDHARDHHDYHDYRGYRDYHGNYYDNQRYVYAPPPVAYVPQPAPGISLFFPLQIR
ncbi:hypothetical protein [Cupriavidus sp. M-11]|uniref:hypothetical protein n=1 Tax=Cupriavidus sp. M-11 TaxID=3233038 RepID=UPI003F8F9468